MENFRDIAGYEGYYQVSDLGNVRALPRQVLYEGGSHRLAEHQMKPHITRRGYLRVPLSKDGAVKRPQVHRLVAIAFLSNPHNYEQVNHLNGIKDDNRVSNLEWVSLQQNINHATVNGLKARGSSIKGSKLQTEQVLEIRRLAATHTRPALAVLFGVSRITINNIIGRHTWTHI